jgi:hypothetical protein
MDQAAGSFGVEICLHTVVTNDGQIVVLLALAAGIEVSCFEPTCNCVQSPAETDFATNLRPGSKYIPICPPRG